MRILGSVLPVVFVGLVGGLAAPGCQEDTVPMVTMSGVVVDVFTAQPIEGAVVCRLDSPDRGCSVTDDDGQFNLRLPANEEQWFTVSRQDYYPFLLAMTTEGEDILLPGPATIGSRAVMEIVLEQTGVVVEPGQGHLLLWIGDETATEGVAGASIAISPDPGGLIAYMDDQGAYSQDATTTSSAGSVGWGNIPPGDYVLTVTHADLECEPYAAGSAGGPNTVKLKTLADHATALFVLCE